MSMEQQARPTPSPDVLRHLVDVHCHPTDSEVTAEAMDNLFMTICAMSSRQSDQPLVRDLAEKYPEKVIPCFGQHCNSLSYGRSIDNSFCYKRLQDIILGSLIGSRWNPIHQRNNTTDDCFHVRRDNERFLKGCYPIYPTPSRWLMSS